MLSKKEQVILNHYKQLIEGQMFDEFDLIGFFIFIRSIIQKSNYPNIFDFCDTIAHRGRDRGKAANGIKAIIQNQYQTENNSKKLKGANGITEEAWSAEWNKFGQNYSFSINDSIIQDISLCVLSLLQGVQIEDNDNNIASLVIVKGPNVLCAATTEGKPDSLPVVFFKVCVATEAIPDDFINDAIYTIRENGKLRLLTENHTYIV